MNEKSSLRIIVRTRDQGIETGEWGTDETWLCSNWKAAYAIVDRLDPGREETLRTKIEIKDPIFRHAGYERHYRLDIGGIPEAADRLIEEANEKAKRKATAERTQNRINALVEKANEMMES